MVGYIDLLYTECFSSVADRDCFRYLVAVGETEAKFCVMSSENGGKDTFAKGGRD